jgi:hypothetical protein
MCAPISAVLTGQRIAGHFGQRADLDLATSDPNSSLPGNLFCKLKRECTDETIRKWLSVYMVLLADEPNPRKISELWLGNKNERMKSMLERAGLAGVPVPSFITIKNWVSYYDPHYTKGGKSGSVVRMNENVVFI